MIQKDVQSLIDISKNESHGVIHVPEVMGAAGEGFRIRVLGM